MALRARHKDAFEKKHGVKLGFMGFFVKACVGALKEVPSVNAEIDGADIIYKNYYHLGVAVGTDKGLVVPVVRDCDRLSVAAIEKDDRRSWQECAGRPTQDRGDAGRHLHHHQRRRLWLADVDADPQCAAIGHFGHAQNPGTPGGDRGKIEIRPMMYLALTYDHRLVDGREAVTFLVRVKEALEDPARLVLDI